MKKRTTKNNIKQRKPIRRPGPYRSQLIPYVDRIKAWRKSGKTWKQVTEELAKLGIKTDPATAYRFIMRWRKRPYAYGRDQEPEPERPAPPSMEQQRAAQQAAPPVAAPAREAAAAGAPFEDEDPLLRPIEPPKEESINERKLRLLREQREKEQREKR